MYCTHASLSTSTVPGRTASASDGTRTVKSSSKLEPTPGDMITFKGQLLLKGMSDDVKISIIEE